MIALLLLVASCATAAASGVGGGASAADWARASDFPANTPTTVPSLPSNLTWDTMWVFWIKPEITKPAPTPPGPYVDAGYPDLNYVGPAPLGYIMAVKYSESSPLKSYDEIIYVPGVYKPSCLSKPVSSAARIWVNDRGTQKAGRCIWGLTKELANFQWAEGPNWRSYTMTDPTGKTTFFANITDSHLVSAALPFVTPLYPRTFPSVQWPVDGVPGSTCEKEDPAYASTIDALSTTPPGLMTWDLTLAWTEPAVGAVVTDYFIDPVTFTGKSEPVRLLPTVARLKDGAGLLTKPKVVRC